MTPFARLLGLVLPACDATGAQGLPEPGLMEMAGVVRPASPNTALAAPAGFSPAPDIITPVYGVPAEALYQAIMAVAAQARATLAAEFPARLQAHFVARSAVCNFPDMITVQAMASGPAASTLVLYSRSVYGYSDFGANRRRVRTWLAGLRSALLSTPER